MHSNNYVQADSYDHAHIVVINTCTVTNKADAKCRNVIRKVKRSNPECILIVCGCLASTNKDDLLQMAEVDIIINNTDKDKIIEVLDWYTQQDVQERPFIYSTDTDGSFNYETSLMSKHSRAFLKLQDGCDNYCSYCKIPYARGKSRSKNNTDILDEISGLIDNGYEEVVLSGINLGSYRYNEIDFNDLLESILRKFIRTRFRISSIEPQYVDDRFIDLFSESAICPHAHIPLQSGSDNVLKLMNRKYVTADYLKIIDALRLRKPNLFLSSDLILGFPGETVDDFNVTYDLVKRIEFAFIHLFGFSPRKGTAADKMKPKVPERIRDERVKTMMALVDDMNYRYRMNNLDAILEVLIERKVGEFYTGKSENYLDVSVKADCRLQTKKRYKVRLTGVTHDSNTGILIEHD